ncbi:hypothetical protein DM02DRAFT_711301 [Periconia macrospinosa]|uniref:Cyanovirin-N domain-containing protein n=1 Tax=Periconia macrospinosa TaxID=97972 RepID=A0A2V1DN86_9PLEO|nr:hypothetical protein DM02DRAFT_711301 [Periconia macrospinosa]
MRIHTATDFLPVTVSSVLLLSAFAAAAAISATAAPSAKKPYVTTSLDIDSECKTCPRSLCPNVDLKVDNVTNEFNVTCWTRGTKIMGDNLWLKTESDCYLTQYDVHEYDGNWDEDLAYCGRQSEEQHLTLEDATLQYKTECRICPFTGSCDVVAYLPEETDVTLTCWTDAATPILDNSYWYKTTNNCYVAEVGLYDRPNRADLDYCGPIPHLEIANHNNENGTSEVNKREPSAEPAELAPQYLIEVKVGEEYSYCYEKPDNTSKVIERYEYNQTVVMQCVTDITGTWYAQSTDFCYCSNYDFWDEPLNSEYYRIPLCEYFGTPADR